MSMVIKTLRQEGSFSCPESDPLFEVKFRKNEEAEVNAARTALSALTDPVNVAQALIGSYPERQQMREEVASHMQVIGTAETFVEETIHELRVRRAQEYTARIASLGKEHFEQALARRAA